jgi:hypothetical protein
MSKKKKEEATTGEPKAKKGFESTYQADKLRESIKAGLSARSIMDKLGIKSKQVLKQHLLKIITEDGKFYAVHGLYEKGGTRIRATPKGELKIGPSVLRAQGLTLAAGDEFHLSVADGVILLSKIVQKDATSADTGQESPLVDDPQTDNDGDDTLPDGTQE